MSMVKVDHFSDGDGRSAILISNIGVVAGAGPEQYLLNEVLDLKGENRPNSLHVKRLRIRALIENGYFVISTWIMVDGQSW